MTMLVETSRVDPAVSLSQLSVSATDSDAEADAWAADLQSAVLDACSHPEAAPGFTEWLRDVVRRLDDPAS